MNAVDLIVEDEAWDRLEGKSALAETAIAAAQCEIDDILPGVIAILLTGDDAVAQLNKSFRGKEGPTNVLSFPASEHADNHLGDVALAWGVVEREAAEEPSPPELDPAESAAGGGTSRLELRAASVSHLGGTVDHQFHPISLSEFNSAIGDVCRCGA